MFVWYIVQFLQEIIYKWDAFSDSIVRNCKNQKNDKSLNITATSTNLAHFAQYGIPKLLIQLDLKYMLI